MMLAFCGTRDSEVYMASRLSRRTFVQAGVATGVAIKVGFLGSRADANLIDNGSALAAWTDRQGRPKYRVDAIAKVTGSKTFSRDFRAVDMPGWPKEQSHAFLIHAARADRVFEGIDLTMLDAHLQPDRLVLAQDLERDRVNVPNPGFYGDRFLVPKGETPQVLGEPVALLIYEDFARFDAAKRKLHFDERVVRWGAATGPKPPPPYGSARFVRIEGATPASEDRYSPLRDTIISGKFSGEDVTWPAADPDGDAVGRGMAAAAEIEREIAANSDSTLTLERDYFSQSVDASAMEADNGNVWYDPATRVLHMIVATQSPYEVATEAAGMVSKSVFGLGTVDLKCGYTVGYGTKDHAVFPYFCIVAGLYGERRPVRLANDRFEQFQMGLKRHAFWMKNTLVVDKASGKFKLMKGEFKCDGGGRANYSYVVGTVGATAAQSIYYLPRSDFSIAVLSSRAVDAGSTRGFGTLQTMSATEMMVDEAAERLNIDAIELRLRNLMQSGMKNTQGAIPAGALRNEELLQVARAHPLWTERGVRKTQFDDENPGKRYGVGFAQVQKDYGSGAECAVATIEFDPAGRVSFRHVAQEIGPGVTTSQPLMVATIIGRMPDRMEFAVVEWPEMPLTSTEEPYSTPQAKEDELKTNPRWTPSFTSPMSASNSVYYLGHATREAARALLRHGLWPAAKAIWSEGIGGGQMASFVVGPDDLRIADGKLTGGGLEPLAFTRVAAKAHQMGLVTGVSVHTFNRWEWAQAEFDVPEVGRVRLPIDALSVKYGKGAPAERKAKMTAGGFHFIERKQVSYPPVQRNNASVTYYAPIATLVEVAVNMATGKVAVLNHHSILECGTQVVPALVSGQIEGGLAMGIGHALHEYLPLYEDGPGNGTWNWNRYRLPRASDVAVWSQSAEVLAPLSDTDPPKGIAEVVMIAIVPAIANAVAHAIGKRFYELPITPEKILKVLT
jgi:CO/xanthine dehydrogenase Mo-binding subunit